VADNVREDYLRALHSLSKVDASKWATFVETIKALALSEYERALSMPASDTQIAVGMNRRIRDLRDDCIHIDSLAGKLHKHGTM
jgi:hypothetical protein